MSFPSDLVRTKNWGSEILTDSDLESQFDLIIAWIMAAIDSATGHAHEGTSNKSPKINVATGLAVTNQAQGDVLYASSASAFARLAVGTKGKCLTTGGAAANPTWEGMTTQGDIEYHDGTSRARLGAGTSGLPLVTKGAAANPAYEKLASGGMSAILGAWVDKSADFAAQQAATDGFVIVTLTGSGTYDWDIDSVGYTDANANPTTVRGVAHVSGGSGAGTQDLLDSFCMPVIKGDYWKVVKTVADGAADQVVYWIPLGS